MDNRVTQLFKITFPIIQGGMVWCSGWELAAAVSNAGGLGLIGSGSMDPETLRNHIRKCKAVCHKPFGVNVPLLNRNIDGIMNVIVNERVKIVFTSAGSPTTWTNFLRSENIIVVHVVSSVKFAIKSQQAGVDAIVAEGFEAGGHNGTEETTTICLIPIITEAVKIPVIAAGGIATGKAVLASMILGADGVQMGTRFVASEECSAHKSFKDKIISAGEGETILTLKSLTPVRLMKNDFCREVLAAENSGAGTDDLRKLLGTGRAKSGMFDGDLVQGELEIGQVSALVNEIKPAAQIIRDIWDEFEIARKHFCKI